MATIEHVKSLVDINDLCERFGITRTDNNSSAGTAMYLAPRGEKNPSLSVYKHGKAFKDHATGEGGSCIDFVIYAGHATSAGEALRVLHETYGLPDDREKPDGGQAKVEQSFPEYLADRCLQRPDLALDYLVSQRGLPESIVRSAFARKAVGFNDYVNPAKSAGERGHGGGAVAFIVRSLNPGHVLAVDLRYLDPALNGGQKTTCQGEKLGAPWFMDFRAVKTAHTVYLVESPVNALSIEACHIPGAVALAIRGISNVDSLDLTPLRGKRVLLCLDHRDAVDDNERSANFGYRPGLRASWRLHERLMALDVSAMMVDQSSWDEGADANDVLVAGGVDQLKNDLKKVEPWLIPGMPGESNGGKPRIFLPSHDFAAYWKFRVKEDFTHYVTKTEAGEDDDEPKKLTMKDLANFRIASITKVSIQSAIATMTGDEDSQPRKLFAVSVQVPRHGADLIRAVFQDEHLHNSEKWKRFGAVYDQSAFLRMVGIWERAAHLGQRDAANFVGLCWKGGELVVNEGTDCYFDNADQQCPYHNLTFPSGTVADAKKVIDVYQATFKKNAALLPLVWALGGHLKVLTGFWPHMEMQADKGMGKTTLIKALERTIAFKLYASETLATDYRILTTICHTSHPIGWEEITTKKQEVIDKAVGFLQQSYQSNVTNRGSELTEFLLSAPVLLAGEDVPVRSLTGKLVRTILTNRKATPIPDDTPKFPVRQWLEYLTTKKKSEVRELAARVLARFQEQSAASGEDEGARRMVVNYAAVGTAWMLLCDFAGIDAQTGDFPRDLVAEMNAHVLETSGDRQPWVWIVEKVISEMARREYKFPMVFDTVQGKPVLLVRTSDVMSHIATSNALRDMWNALPVKSDRVFKRQLVNAKAVLLATDGTAQPFERVMRSGEFDPGRRVSNLVALDLDMLEQYGVYAVGAADVLRPQPGALSATSV